MNVILTQISRDWKECDEQDYRKMWIYARYSKFITIFSLISTVGSSSACFFAFLVQIYTDEIYKNGTSLRPQCLHSYYPFESQRSPNFEIVTILQVAGGTLIAIVYTSFDAFYVASILHFSGQLDILSKRMKGLIEEQKLKMKTFSNILKSALIKHKQIIRLSKYPIITFNNY